MTVTTNWSRAECQQFCSVLQQIQAPNAEDSETKYIELQEHTAIVTTDASKASSFSNIISAIEQIATTALAHLNKNQVSLLQKSLERIKDQLQTNQNSWYTYLFLTTDNASLLQKIAVAKEIFLLHSIRHENPLEQKVRREFKNLPPDERFDMFFNLECSKRAKANRNTPRT